MFLPEICFKPELLNCIYITRVIMPHISPVTFYIDYSLSYYCYFLMYRLQIYYYTDLYFLHFLLFTYFKYFFSGLAIYSLESPKNWFYMNRYLKWENYVREVGLKILTKGGRMRYFNILKYLFIYINKLYIITIHVWWI